MGFRAWAATLAALGALSCSGSGGEEVQLVLRNGVVWTGVPEAARAQAVAVRGGRVVAVGSNEEIDALGATSARVVELDGRTLMPGFVDAHTHFVSGGFQLSSVDLRDAATPEELAERIADFARTVPPGTWITGGDWDHELWGGRLPERRWIDSVTPEHPVFVQRLDGHMALVNTLAMRLAGVDEGGSITRDPAGGTIVRDPDTGEAGGVFKDEAMGLISAVIPAPSERDLDEALRAAASHALSLGVTQVHDMGSWSHLETYRRARETGSLPLRVYSVVPMATWERMRDYVAEHGRGDDRLWWGGLKAFVDGSLGSTTAWFYDPYVDEPGTTGLMTTDTAELRGWIQAADAEGLHVIVHAIGDRANDWLLDAYEATIEANGVRDRRFRVEHAQHLSASALGRFGQMDVIASMQPYHAADDGRWAETRIGRERLSGTYAFRSLLDRDARVAFGSDWTVAPLDPILGLDAAVTRRTIDGENPGGWVPEQRITLEETLRAYTVEGARAGFIDDRVGTLREGMLADLVVLSENVFEVEPESLADVQVDMTFVEGELAFERRE